ncbi:MAG: tetratricopeptide repeat protein [Candidatus Tectomicrobia bacterium]|nr:tetratricopeptide repeat protein [Candidatus Tectomicrobia bacterium]
MERKDAGPSGGYRDWREALFREEHLLRPDDATPRYALGVAAYDRGAYAEAISHLSAAVAGEPTNTAAYQLLARAALALERPDEARRWLQRGIEAARQAYHHYHRQEMLGLLEQLDEPG